jgi:protein-L-isoaspartate(D-aspartate) O-methyltransferase
MTSPLLAWGMLLLAGCNTAAPQVQPEQKMTELRKRMVADQMRARDIRDDRVLAAMERVPRHRFVSEEQQSAAYEDYPLAIGHGQTISQPYIVAFMTQALQVRPEDKVLEIGTGSGYQAAVLGELAGRVYTIEIVEPLARAAEALLKELGYANVHVRAGNGYAGWPEEAPFDRIMVTAAPDEIPPALVEQLKIGGLMAIPVGTAVQELRIMRKTEKGMEVLQTLPVRFVPMTGKDREFGSSGVREFGSSVVRLARSGHSRAGGV